MIKKLLPVISAFVLIFGTVSLVLVHRNFKSGDLETSEGVKNEIEEEKQELIDEPPEMDPENIDPSKFSTAINNTYFSLPVGRELTYEGETEDGVEKIVISIPGDTKEVMGVKTLVYRDKVWIDGVLVEDTRDYLAQDELGNVWYFGEDVDNYEDGKLADHEGSWLAGVDGALPGIWIKAKHVVGDSYRQEYYKGKAEDMRDVVSVGDTITTKMGTYKDCVKMYDWTPLDPKAEEHKTYCHEVGAMVLEVDLATKDKIELISVK